MIRIEILFPEVCNLFGDPFNVIYLQKSLGDECELIRTSLTEKPAFTDTPVDMVYMGAMSESTQMLAVEALMPYRETIRRQIDEGRIFLLTGNAMEIFGDSITHDDKVEHPALGITGLRSQTDMMHRYNTLFMGTLSTEEGDIPVNAFKSTFSFSFGSNEDQYMLRCVRGCGINKESRLEGVRIRNCFCTYLIGPVLVLNPDFACYLLRLMGVKEPKLAFEDVARECFRIRAEVLSDSNTKYLL